MSAMASQITSISTFCSAVCSGTHKKSKLRVTGLCEGNPPVTGGFLSQKTTNAENISIWWRQWKMHRNVVRAIREVWIISTLFMSPPHAEILELKSYHLLSSRLLRACLTWMGSTIQMQSPTRREHVLKIRFISINIQSIQHRYRFYIKQKLRYTHSYGLIFNPTN